MDLQFLVNRLREPPFQQSLTPLQLTGESSDGLTQFQLTQLLHQVVVHADSVNPYSVHRPVQIRQEDPEQTADRILEFALLMKYKTNVTDSELSTLKQRFLAGDRFQLLDIMEFLLRNEVPIQKRAYLAPFLTPPGDIPPEYAQNEQMQSILNQYREMQGKFKETHRAYDQLQQQLELKSEQKKDLKAMEEDKNQLLAKINKIAKRIEQIPNHRQWMESAKKLRIEQNQEFDILDKLNEQRQELFTMEQRIADAQLRQKEIRSNLGVSPEALLQKLQDDVQMNQYMVTEKLPKMIQEKMGEIQEMHGLLRRPPPSTREIQLLEQQLMEQSSALVDQKLKMDEAPDERFNVFKQQATMIARKKEAAAEQLGKLMEEQTKLAQLVEKKKANAALNAKVPKGEALKNYIDSVRNKAAVYKDKKRELSEISAELGVLQRTFEVLNGQMRNMQMVSKSQEKLLDLGLSDGFSPLAQKMQRSSVDEIHRSAGKLENAIQMKKEQLAPTIKEVRDLRQQVLEMEHKHQEKRKQYDATMMGMDTEIVSLEQELKQKRAQIQDLERKIFQGKASFQILKVTAEKVASEMKSYMGGDEQLEQLQKRRGFKTYRDLYNKKIAELEVCTKQLREEGQSVAAKHAPGIKQQELFQDVYKLLQLKANSMQTLIKARQTQSRDTMKKQESLVPDRLVL